MYLLYLDESGNHSNARHFVLAGVSVYETSVYWAKDQLDRIQSDYFPDSEDSVLFHAASLRVRDGTTIPAPFENSRLLQIADLIANTVYGRYESGHASRFDSMLRKFDQDESGRMHGLLHLTGSRHSCYLPCCLTRRPQTTG